MSSFCLLTLCNDLFKDIIWKLLSVLCIFNKRAETALNSKVFLAHFLSTVSYEKALNREILKWYILIK